LRLEPEQREFWWQQPSVMCADERVHARAVRIDFLTGLVGQTVPGRTGRTAESDGSEEPILRNRRIAKNLRQSTMADAALELHLPETILGMDVAEAIHRVEFR